ncbi:hypothetical protein DSECCO2_572950 [anaerobic digester metagenome]
MNPGVADPTGHGHELVADPAVPDVRPPVGDEDHYRDKGRRPPLFMFEGPQAFDQPRRDRACTSRRDAGDPVPGEVHAPGERPDQVRRRTPERDESNPVAVAVRLE